MVVIVELEVREEREGLVPVDTEIVVDNDDAREDETKGNDPPLMLVRVREEREVLI